ncbi:ATP-binding protein [Streptomyces sp. NPDC090057]|uniref:ATP-binding protein n=1 Tax=Streptomyces sp. NPDC090057 TaxID=3365935 RepID=UPI0037FE911D
MSNVTCASPGGASPGAAEAAGSGRLREPAPVGAGLILAVAALPASAHAVPRLRRLARAVAHRRGLSDAAEEALTVVVSELATNVVLHSGSADLTVMLAAGDTALTVEVRDRGRWRERPAPRCEQADMDAEFGRGLALVDAYSVDRYVRRSDEGTLMRVVIAL